MITTVKSIYVGHNCFGVFFAVPSGSGSSATIEFSVPVSQRFAAQQTQQLTREERLDEFADQVSVT